MPGSTASSPSASIASAGLVAIGFERADPLVGLAITAVILEITWDAWHTVRADAHA